MRRSVGRSLLRALDFEDDLVAVLPGAKLGLPRLEVALERKRPLRIAERVKLGVDNGLMPAIQLAGEKLAEVANAVSKVKANFYGRGPEGAKAYLNDNLLVVVLRGGFLDVEETLIERGRSDKVRDLRITWEEELEAEMTQEVERVTGLKVSDYHSQVLIRARVIVELFLLANA
jgi:uncharacterized protein YbcI